MTQLFAYLLKDILFKKNKYKVMRTKLKFVLLTLEIR